MRGFAVSDCTHEEVTNDDDLDPPARLSPVRIGRLARIAFAP
jgi:hypothetical protein